MEKEDSEMNCRMCAVKTIEPLRHPCKCRGALKYVHESCWKRYNEARSSDSRVNVCENCSYEVTYADVSTFVCVTTIILYMIVCTAFVLPTVLYWREAPFLSLCCAVCSVLNREIQFPLPFLWYGPHDQKSILDSTVRATLIAIAYSLGWTSLIWVATNNEWSIAGEGGDRLLEACRSLLWTLCYWNFVIYDIGLYPLEQLYIKCRSWILTVPPATLFTCVLAFQAFTSINRPALLLESIFSSIRIALENVIDYQSSDLFVLALVLCRLTKTTRGEVAAIVPDTIVACIGLLNHFFLYGSVGLSHFTFYWAYYRVFKSLYETNSSAFSFITLLSTCINFEFPKNGILKVLSSIVMFIAWTNPIIQRVEKEGESAGIKYWLKDYSTEGDA